MSVHPWLAYDALRPERSIPCGAVSLVDAVKSLEARGAVSVVVSFDGAMVRPERDNGLGAGL